jgi:hypothetical protein
MNNKIKYIIFGVNAEYVKYALLDILHDENIVFVEYNISQKIIIKLTFLLCKILRISRSINRMVFPFFFKKKWINADETPVFWFFEYNLMSCNRSFILYLKKLFPNSKTILYLTNAVGKGNQLVLDIMRQKTCLYDMIITYNREDAQKYNLTYHQWIYSPINKTDNIEKKYDLFFIGHNKERLNLIQDIAATCKKNNMMYDFNVFDSNYVDNNRYGINIIKKKMPYSENIYKIRKSKCVLELIPNSVQAGTLRTAEIIATGTKLLTNNQSLKDDAVFNEHQMSIFTSIDDIDLNFLKKDADINLFNDRNMLSPKRFLQFLETELFN